MLHDSTLRGSCQAELVLDAGLGPAGCCTSKSRVLEVTWLGTTVWVSISAMMEHVTMWVDILVVSAIVSEAIKSQQQTSGLLADMTSAQSSEIWAEWLNTYLYGIIERGRGDVCGSSLNKGMLCRLLLLGNALQGLWIALVMHSTDFSQACSPEVV